jgi:hypothetical protein
MKAKLIDNGFYSIQDKQPLQDDSGNTYNVYVEITKVRINDLTNNINIIQTQIDTLKAQKQILINYQNLINKT